MSQLLLSVMSSVFGLMTLRVSIFVPCVVMMQNLRGICEAVSVVGEGRSLFPVGHGDHS